jgi:hypothetical protein
MLKVISQHEILYCVLWKIWSNLSLFLWKYYPTDTAMWNLLLLRRWCIRNVYTLSLIFLLVVYLLCRSHWPRGLRRKSTAALLLRSWVWIPPGAWISVCCDCCVCSGRGLCDELITRPEESYRLWCVVCDLEKQTSWMRRRPRPTRGLSHQEEKRGCLLCYFLFKISRFFVLLHLHFFYAKTGISLVKLADSDPTGQGSLQLLWSLEVQ